METETMRDHRSHPLYDKPDRTPADCGAEYDHDPHLYRTERGKVKACDGTTTKKRGK